MLWPSFQLQYSAAVDLRVCEIRPPKKVFSGGQLLRVGWMSQSDKAMRALELTHPQPTCRQYQVLDQYRMRPLAPK